MRSELRNPDAWFTRIARNVCTDLHRERHRDPLVAIGDDSWWSARADERGATAEERLLTNERVRLTRAAMTRLPSRMQQAVRLLDRDTSHAELAELLGITTDNARKRVEQARRQLRREVATLERRRNATDAPEWPEIFPPSGESTATIAAVSGGRAIVVYGRRGDVLTASRLDALRAYVARHPRGWRMRMSLARAELIAGNVERAASELAAVVEGARSSAAAIQLALLARQAGNPAWRAACATAAGAADPAAREVLDALLCGSARKAVRRTAALARRRGTRDSHFIAATVALADGQPHEALRWTEPFSPSDVIAAGLRIEALAALGRFAEAAIAAEQLAVIDPANRVVWLAIARGAVCH